MVLVVAPPLTMVVDVVVPAQQLVVVPQLVVLASMDMLTCMPPILPLSFEVTQARWSLTWSRKHYCQPRKCFCLLIHRRH